MMVGKLFFFRIITPVQTQSQTTSSNNLMKEDRVPRDYLKLPAVLKKRSKAALS
jgi:hypothetical protein